MSNNYQLGDVVRVTATFTTSGGAALDPTAVLFQYKGPDGVVVTKTYGVDMAVVREAAGKYHLDVSATAVGDWYYRVYSTGSGQAAAEGEFIVDPTEFA